MVTRRRFLHLGLTGAAGLITGCRPSDLVATGAWGGTPEAALSTLVPEGRRPEGVLDLFLWGGFSPWESFYAVPENGHPDAGGPNAGEQWWLFQEGPWNIHDALDACEFSGELLQPFGTDALGRTVNLGPFVWPLRERTDILDRMRVIVMRHDQLPHQGACPLMLGGQLRGSTRLAGTAAHVERYFRERLTGVRPEPHSYVLYPADQQVGLDNVEAASAVGQHGGAARPLSIRLRADDLLSQQLDRRSLRAPPSLVDDMLRQQFRSYRERLRPGPNQDRLEASSLDAWGLARDTVARSRDLSAILTPELLAARSGSECGVESDFDRSLTGLGIATSLLTHPDKAARYVTAVDAGVVNYTTCAPYDAHDLHSAQLSVNTTHAMRTLAGLINTPGEGDPRKLDLDRHTVLITTEFGRSPWMQENTEGGTDHWPHGYVVVAIGGFVGPEQAGVVGAIGDDGRAVEYFTPAELRAASLLGMGIWPFGAEAFRVGDMQSQQNELDAAAYLKSALLGYAS